MDNLNMNPNLNSISCKFSGIFKMFDSQQIIKEFNEIIKIISNKKLEKGELVQNEFEKIFIIPKKGKQTFKCKFEQKEERVKIKTLSNSCFYSLLMYLLEFIFDAAQEHLLYLFLDVGSLKQSAVDRRNDRQVDVVLDAELQKRLRGHNALG